MLSIAPDVTQVLPDAKMGFLLMTNINTEGKLSQDTMTKTIAAIHAKYEHLDRKSLKESNPIQSYISYYKSFGYSYHVLAQLESMLKGKKSPHTESGILQAMFLTELESMLLTAGHDASKLQIPLELQIAKGNETYVSISGKEECAIKDDLMVHDQKSILSSILRGPDYASRITPDTTEALFTIYAPPGINTELIMKALKELEGRLTSFSPLAETVLLQVYHAVSAEETAPL